MINRSDRDPGRFYRAGRFWEDLVDSGRFIVLVDWNDKHVLSSNRPKILPARENRPESTKIFQIVPVEDFISPLGSEESTSFIIFL